MRCRLDDFKIKTFIINKKNLDNSVSVVAMDNDVTHIAQYGRRLSDLGDLYLLEMIDFTRKDEHGNNGMLTNYALYSKDFKLTSGLRFSTSEMESMSVTEQNTTPAIKRLRSVFPEDTEKDTILFKDFVLLKKPSHGFTYIEHFGVPYLYTK